MKRRSFKRGRSRSKGKGSKKRKAFARGSTKPMRIGFRLS